MLPLGSHHRRLRAFAAVADRANVGPQPLEAPGPLWRPAPVAGLTVGRADVAVEPTVNHVAGGALSRLRRTVGGQYHEAGGQLHQLPVETQPWLRRVGAQGGIADESTDGCLRGQVADGNDRLVPGAEIVPVPTAPPADPHRVAQPRVRRVHISMERYKSLHKEQNQEFLRSAEIHPKRKDFDLAVAAAILLDHDYDARPILMGHLDDIEAQAPLFFPGVDGDDVANQIPYWIDQSPAFLSDYLREYIEDASGPERSAITWGPVDERGQGTRMEAILRPGGHAEGSSAGGWNPWAAVLARRADNHSTFYVRGHLLNRHLGGPGLDYNMVPLTQRSAFGGNDANAAHSKVFEEVVKRKHLQMDEEGEQVVHDLEYDVTVNGKGRPRSSTKVALKKSDELLGVINDFKLRSMTQKPLGYGLKSVDELDDNTVDTLFEMQYGNLWPQGQALPTPKKREAIARLYEGHRSFETPLGSTDEGRLLLQTLLFSGWSRWLQVVCADRAGKAELLSLDELKERIAGNRILWEREDELIPAGLTVHARWYQYGEFSDFGPQEILIQKPDDLYSPYWHERESFI